MRAQPVSYAAPKFAKERGCRTIVLVPDKYETRVGLALSSEPLLVPSLVAVRAKESPESGIGVHRYRFPLLYEKLMLNVLVNGHPQAPLSTLQALRKDYPQMAPTVDTIYEADNDEQVKELSDPLLFGRDALSPSLNESYTIYSLFSDGGHLNIQAFDSELQYMTLLEKFIRHMFVQVVSRFESNLVELQELTGAFRVNQEPKRAEEGGASGSNGAMALSANMEVTETAEGDTQDVKQEKKARSKAKRPCVQVTKDDTIVADTDIPIYQPESELRQITAATSNIFGTNNRSLLATRERLQLFHKRRRLNYLAAPYLVDNYTIALVLPDTVTRAEIAIWTELVYNRLQFSGTFITTATPMASSFSSTSCITVSATATGGKVSVSDHSNFSLNSAYAPLPICGDVILGTVAGLLSALVDASHKKASSVDSTESTTNISALHDFLHLYLLTESNAALYFQGEYAQLLEKVVFSDNKLLTQYMNCKRMCSPEEFNTLAESILKHILFNSEHVLFSMLQNNSISYAALTRQENEDVQPVILTLSQLYPYDFLTKISAGHRKEQVQVEERDGGPPRFGSVVNCLTVSLGYVGLLIAVSLTENWLFDTPKPHFPVLCTGKYSGAGLDRMLVTDINFTLRTLSTAEHTQNLNANRLLAIDGNACMVYFSIPFDTLKQEVLELRKAIASSSPAQEVTVNAVLAAKYNTPISFPSIRTVLCSVFLYLLRLSHVADVMFKKEENKGKAGQQPLTSKEGPPEELENSDATREPAPKSTTSGALSASGPAPGFTKAKAPAASQGIAGNSKVFSVLQMFRAVSTSGVLMYLPRIVEYVGQNLLTEKDCLELLELGVQKGDVALESSNYEWLDQNFRIGPDRTASLEWLGAAWSTLCDNGIDCYVAQEEFQAYGVRVLMERALFYYP